MTDVEQPCTEWVPRMGMLEVSRERAELIRGLFELAAWVADHPDLPLPDVTASVPDGSGDWAVQCGVVDRVAGALGRVAVDRPEVGFYEVEADFGSVRTHCTAITREHMAAYWAHMSYSDSVQPETTVGGVR